MRTDKIRLGAQGATNDFNDMIFSFHKSRERRMFPPDDCKDHIKKLDKFRPDEYFYVRDYIKQPKLPGDNRFWCAELINT